jgi:hypothetical protein
MFFNPPIALFVWLDGIDHSHQQCPGSPVGALLLGDLMPQSEDTLTQTMEVTHQWGEPSKIKRRFSPNFKRA